MAARKLLLIGITLAGILAVLGDGCDKQHEESRCVLRCPPQDTCQNRNVQVGCAYDPKEKCENKCICNNGFYRNSEGGCVTRNECEIAECNKANEEIRCVLSCPPQDTCQNRNVQVSCLYDPEEKCENKCVCKNGYYRNPEGGCVTEDDCVDTST